MTENFPKINVRHLTTAPCSSENTKQDKCRKTTLCISFSNYKKIKDKWKILKKARGEKTPHLYRVKNKNYI